MRFVSEINTMNQGCYRVKEKGVVELVQKCKELQRLDLQGLTITGDKVLDCLAQNHPETLRYLNIWGTRGEKMGLYVTTLKAYYLTGAVMVTHSGIETLFQACISLKKLILKFCKSITDGNVAFQHLIHATNLRHLDIQGEFFF